MTENERMSIIGLLDVLNTGISFSTCHMEYAIQSNVLEDLIGCLEELEQYRAIGTVEELQKIKDVITDFPIDFGSPISNVEEIWNQLKKYLAIGTIDEFKSLKEKNEAKKPIVQMRGVYDDDSGDWLRDEEWNMCPTCKIRNQVYHTWKWCHYCGQKLDWSE